MTRKTLRRRVTDAMTRIRRDTALIRFRWLTPKTICDGLDANGNAIYRPRAHYEYPDNNQSNLLMLINDLDGMIDELKSLQNFAYLQLDWVRYGPHGEES